MPRLPYEGATAGGRALAEIEKILRRFGCSKFGTMNDWERGVLMVQFEWRGHRISLEASFRGYAEKFLEAHPGSAETTALKRGEVAAPSILRDWIKGQITAVEVGLMPFEHAFTPYAIAKDGRRVVEHIVEARQLLEAPSDG